MTKMSPMITKDIMLSFFPRSSILIWSGVFLSSISFIIKKTWPNSVFSPVATTIPIPFPDTERVPMKAMFFLSVRARVPSTVREIWEASCVIYDGCGEFAEDQKATTT